jgi:hypothetical protein
LWYGSYFVETCPKKDAPVGCGGSFLIYQDLSGKPPQERTVNGITFTNEWEMLYTITFDTMNPNDLPMRNDPALREVLGEANRIVGSIVYK